MPNKREQVDKWVQQVARTDRQIRNRKLKYNPAVQAEYQRYVKGVGKGSAKMTKNQFYNNHYPVR